MKQFLTILLGGIVVLGISTSLSAAELSPQKVERLDRKMSKTKTHSKHFRTEKEYRKMKQKGMLASGKKSSRKKISRREMPSNRKVSKRYVDNGWYDRWEYPRGPRQRGYRNFKRGWYLAYRYDRVSFYDRYGYEYGYFNRYGFYFDGIFYAYDRYYRYRDRLRGRGLFDNSYYIPSNAERYGLCQGRPIRRRPIPFL